MKYLNAIEERLNEHQAKALKDIFEPTVVGVPLADSRRDVCILPSGEIRSYTRMHGNGVSEGVVEITYGEKVINTVKMAKACPTGISYLMIQCACAGDSKGVYVKSMEKNG